MKTWHKALLAAALVPIVTIGGFAIYRTVTHIDEIVTTGSAYGFNIGSSESQAFGLIQRQRVTQPNIAVSVQYGPRGGDNFTLNATDIKLEKLESYGHWTILLDGPNNTFRTNTIGLTFLDDRLVEIHRHRQVY